MKEMSVALERGLSTKARAFIALSVFALLISILWVPAVLERPGSSLRAERLLEEIRHGLRPEMAKLLLVTEQYRDSNFKVIFDGAEHNINSVLAWARAYLQRTYDGEAAEMWVKAHLYRSSDRGEVIYLQSPDGNRRPLRDVLLEELRGLPLA